MSEMQKYYKKFIDLQTKDLSSEELENQLVEITAEYVKKVRKVSITNIQRTYRIGYNRAFRVVEALEEKGVISSCGHNGARIVL